ARRRRQRPRKVKPPKSGGLLSPGARVYCPARADDRCRFAVDFARLGRGICGSIFTRKECAMSRVSAPPARTLLRLAAGIVLPLSLIVAIPAARAAAVCSVAHIYDVQAQDNRDTSQVGVSAGINSQSPSIYPGRTVPGPRR